MDLHNCLGNLSMQLRGRPSQLAAKSDVSTFHSQLISTKTPPSELVSTIAYSELSQGSFLPDRSEDARPIKFHFTAGLPCVSLLFKKIYLTFCQSILSRYKSGYFSSDAAIETKLHGSEVVSHRIPPGLGKSLHVYICVIRLCGSTLSIL